MFEAISVLLAFVVFAIAFERARLGSIAGLLIAGAVIGPHGFSIIRHVETISVLAELGVSFLLFNIGMELKLERLRLYGARMYLLATSQILLTAMLFAAVGVWLDLGIEAAAIVGLALALSSTALVLKALADRGRTLTQLGRLAIAILLIQDVAAGFILILVQSLGTGPDTPASAGLAFVYALLVAAAIVAAGHFVLPHVLRHVSEQRSQEAFLATILLVVLGSGWVMELAGFSAAIGAFLAGLAIAETPYRPQVSADIAPFRGLLLGIFFIAVGAELDLALIGDNLAFVLVLAVAIIAAKAILLFGLALGLGHPRRLAVEVGALLSQGSEFAFIILPVAMGANLLPVKTGAILMAAIGLSLLIGAAFVGTAGRLVDRIEGAALASPEELNRELRHEANHVLVVGFGNVGMALTRHLMSIKIPVVVIDYSSSRVRESRQRGLPVFYGNALRADVLRSCGIASAQMVVVSIPDHDVTRRILDLIRRIAPRQKIVARASTEESIDLLLNAGANVVVEDSLTTALELAERVAMMYAPAMPEARKKEE